MSLDKKSLGDGLFVAMHIGEKCIVSELYFELTPMTCMSFAGLATGKFDGHVSKDGNYFDDTVFHRVVDGFVIQGGDPTATGRGGPGYQFPDEFDESLRHTGSGMLSMANAGAGTNGSQFFITLAATPHLDGKHSIFGEVVQGKDIPETISQSDCINSCEIIANGEKANAFLESITWDAFMQKTQSYEEDQKKKVSLKQQESIKMLESDATLEKTKDGIYLHIESRGDGEMVQKGSKISVHYELSLLGSEDIIDSSFVRNEAISLVVGSGQVIEGWEKVLLELCEGDVARAIIPPELGYGEQGAGGVIPPQAFLDFKMQIVSV